MRPTHALLVACALVAAAVPAAAQPQAPSEPQPPQEPARPAAGRLNLKLEDPARYTRETPREAGGNTELLPALGADARPVPSEPASPARTASPYPPDTAPGR